MFTGFSAQDGDCVLFRKGRWLNYQVAKSNGISTSSSRQVYPSRRLSTLRFHLFRNFLAIRNRMSTMLSNVSLDHDEGMDVQEASTFRFSEEPSLEKIRQMQSEFAKERDWDQFHQPRNLVLAMVGEVGEVAELFQWKGEVQEGLPDWTPKEKHHLAQELSDVLVYLVRLAEKCHVDLPQEVVAKIVVNSKKYPAHLVKGSSKKYTEYKDMDSLNP